MKVKQMRNKDEIEKFWEEYEQEQEQEQIRQQEFNDNSFDDLKEMVLKLTEEVNKLKEKYDSL